MLFDVVWCRRSDSNRHVHDRRQILSLVRIPISPLRQRVALCEARHHKRVPVWTSTCGGNGTKVAKCLRCRGGSGVKRCLPKAAPDCTMFLPFMRQGAM